ncbi:MAG: hypothetical protein ACPG32_05375 [Akkermansiaceae bacterium]
MFLSCLWDSDTLAEEAAGRGEEVKVMVGWFDRNPAEYYQMRLSRVRGELKEKPEDLALYDDAAVALERLHRSREAIEIMAQKKRVLDTLPESEAKEEHTYRYYANLGTFYAHAWFSQAPEARLKNTAELSKAESLIEKAIELNEDAHFGREKYQLMALQWLNPAHEERYKELSSDLDRISLMAFDPAPEVAKKGEAAEGLAGLIRLGAAWRSIDVYTALVEVYQEQNRASLAYIAQLRVNELAGSGLKSAHYNPKTAQEVMSYVGKSTPRKTKPLEEWYGKARAAANDRHVARTSYMQKKMAKGMHPDTHAYFWDGWKEPDFPRIHYSLVPKTERSEMKWILIGGALVTGVTLIVMIQIKRKARS